MSSTILNVGLSGAGRIAGVHATAVSNNPGRRLVAVSDINHAAAEKLAAQYRADVRTTDAILNRRFDSNSAALKAAANHGEIGKTELLSITSFDRPRRRLLISKSRVGFSET
jgi:predicted dehydrogenase